MNFPRVPPYTAPSLVREEYFYPRQDAELLRTAMKGLGTDERAIVTVLSERTNQQRQEIAQEFSKSYNKDLVKNFKSELSGDLKDLVVSAMTPMPEFYARELHDAMSGPGTNEDVLCEVLCTLNNEWLHDISAAYIKLYDTPLERDIKKDTAGSFERLLVALARGNRDESPVVDEDAVRNDAEALLKLGEGRYDADDSKFISLLVSRSIPHLRKVFIEYEKHSGNPFEEIIRREFAGSTEKGMLALVKSIRNSAEFFAERLHASMAGLGTNERTLNRIVVTRAEFDLEDIKQAFVLKYKKSLATFVEGDTSGDYKKMLLMLIK